MADFLRGLKELAIGFCVAVGGLLTLCLICVIAVCPIIFYGVVLLAVFKLAWEFLTGG